MTLTPRPASQSMLGRADLLRAMAVGRDDLTSDTAKRIGLVLKPAKESRFVPGSLGETAAEPRTALSESAGYPNEIDDVSLWLPTHYQESTDQTRESNDDDEAESYWEWTNPPEPSSQFQSIAPWSHVRPKLKKALNLNRLTRRVDSVKLTRWMADRRLIRQIPRLKKRQFSGEIYLVVDRSAHLIPYFDDQDYIVQKLTQLLPRRRVVVLEGQAPRSLVDANPILGDTGSGNTGESPLRQPSPGSQVIVLGDLGALNRQNAYSTLWYEWVTELESRGCQMIALAPCRGDQMPKRLRDRVRIQPWQKSTASSSRFNHDTGREAQIRLLLTLAAPTVRLEPGLLRGLRLLLPTLNDYSLESAVWQSSLLSSNHLVAATIDRQIAKNELKPDFERLPADIRRRALAVIRNWRARTASTPEIWLEEVIGLSPESRDLLAESSDVDDARALWRHFGAVLADDSPVIGNPVTGLDDYADRFTRRATDAAIGDAKVGKIIHRLRYKYNSDLGIHPSAEPADFATTGQAREFAVDIHHHGVQVSLGTNRTGTAPPKINVTSTNGRVKVGVFEFWKTSAPEFASAFGTDHYGAWFEFRLPKFDDDGFVTQRMRWVPSGSFLMGSPADESERIDNEIQHQVTLSNGFWLANTVCTQDLWESLSGQNPSHFKGHDRPVEQVDFSEVEGWLDELATRIPGLNPQLPTEAQWEYACRAGTTTPFSFGESITSDQVNFDGTYSYRNSPKTEYRQATVATKSLPPNGWGLHEMHGNVLEWCRDWYGPYAEIEQRDPSGPKSGSARVVRGGSWINFARHVRSAYRYGYRPGYRSSDLGFRLLSSASAEPTELAQVPVAEQGPKLDRVGGAGEFSVADWLDAQRCDRMQIKTKSPIRVVVQTDQSETQFQRVTRPSWAVSYGEDHFGVYADFQVKSVVQRMRWIPPGSFSMGSPPGEPGRSDDETQHSVVISDGYWMFDTPCTQHLWTAVMSGNNPSHFQEPERPVEQVSWQEAGEFAEQLSAVIGDLRFSLPSEAQWEYACRAGSTTALYSGAIEILGDANAPDLDEIAWYGGNSGFEYDHETSSDMDVDWLKEKQYVFQRGGTRKVALKKPNGWGLYDMLGNVWEWCEDWHGDYQAESEVDPVGPQSGSDRVVRGGSWFDDARHVRSAFRLWFRPGNRYDDLGFRLLSSAKPSQKK